MTGLPRRFALLTTLVAAALVVVGAPPALAAPQPVLVSTSPANGAAVKTAAQVSATYDVALSSASTLVVRDSTSTPISGTTGVAGNTVTFTPVPAITAAGSPYTATATVKDALSGLLTTVSTWSFTVDTTPPGAPTIASVDGDNATPGTGKDTTPTIVVGGVVAGDTVSILDGATAKGTKVVPAAATSVTFNAGAASDVTLSGDGGHSLTATASDPAGNVSPASSAFVYNLDTTAPAVPTITSVEGDASSPAAGNDTTPTILVAGVTAGDTVRVLEGATVRGTKVVPAAQNTVTFNSAETDTEVTLSGNGNHSLTATATDPPGNPSAASSAFVYNLDTTAPAAPTITSVAGDSSSPAAGNDATPTIVVSGVTAGDTVAILDGATQRGSKVVPGGASTVTFNAASDASEVTLPTDGDHSLTATSTDPVGNASPASAAFVYFLDTGSAGPSLVTKTPDGSKPVQPPATVSAAYDKPLDPAHSTITVRNKFDNGVAGNTTFGPDGRTIVFTPTSPLTQAGSPYAVSTDVSDVNAHTTASSWTFSVDTTAPAAPAVASVEGDASSPAAGNDPTPTVVVSGVTAGDTVTLLEGATVRGTKVVPDSASTVTFNAAEADTEVTVAGLGNHTLTATATDPAGNVSPASASFVYTLVSFDGTFHSLTPARILDTHASTKLGPGATRDLKVTGAGGVPATGVTAVVMNVTVTEPTAASFLTVYPAGATRPATSNINYQAGQTVPNLVVVKVGTGGNVTFYNAAGSTHVIADVVGWYSDDSVTSGARYTALNPARILDTHSSTKLGPEGSRDLTVTGAGGVPATGVSAVVLNVTVTEPTAASFLTVYPTGATRPVTSNLNYQAGQTVANLVVAKLGTAGKVTFYNAAGSTHVIADVVGWFSDDTAPTGARYTALTPARILDTHASAKVGPGGTRDLTVTGAGGVPATGVSAVVLNVTVTEPTAASFLTVYPAGTTRPTTSNLNYSAGQTVANLVVVKVGTGGGVTFYNAAGSTHVIADVVGWYNTE